jgi:hypothetical protein
MNPDIRNLQLAKVPRQIKGEMLDPGAAIHALQRADRSDLLREVDFNPVRAPYWRRLCRFGVE